MLFLDSEFSRKFKELFMMLGNWGLGFEGGYFIYREWKYFC